MAEFRKTKTPGVFIRHQKACPAAEKDGPRCRCTPSYRGRRRDLGWSPTFATKPEAETWKAQGAKSAPDQPARKADGPKLKLLAAEWLAGAEAGTIAKRRGRDAYSDTTLIDYRNSLTNYVLPKWGERAAGTVETHEWQAWVDGLSREGLSRSRIVTHLAVVRAIYGWASRPSRKLVASDPTRGIEMPPNREVPRLRVAHAPEAVELLAALSEQDAVPYAIAFYTGARLGEVDRMHWEDLFMDVRELIVWKSKSRAGTNRRIPIAAPLVPMLKREHMRQGRPESGRLLGDANITSCGLEKRARKAWGWTWDAGTHEWLKGPEAFEWITMHSCRHTYASFLMAAGYNLRELMEFMGHSSLQATERYVKMLPQAKDEKRADRLNAYLEGAM
jgi:integrase